MTPAAVFENSFTSSNAGERIDFDRERLYDSEYGIHYSRIRHTAVAAEPGPKTAPGRDWIVDALGRMVVGQGGGRALPRSAPRLDWMRTGRRLEIESFPIERYTELCEEEYVFGGLADNLIGSPETPKAQRFLNLIGNRWLGNSINRRNVTIDDVEAPLRWADELEAPIQLLLPAMPFKDQCAFRADAPADHIDVGEFSFLVRLHCLALAVNQMHKYDCECVIISDGSVYASMLGSSRVDAIRYLQHLRDARDRLNLRRSIHIVDLDSLVRKDDQYRRSLGYPTHRALRNRIRREIEAMLAGGDGEAAPLGILALGMRWNVNSRRFIESGDVKPADLWRWLRSSPRERQQVSSIPAPLLQSAETAAIEYASFNLAISYTSLLARYFPHAIRLTSHAKKGQVMAPRIGNVFPWNGVGFSDSLDPATIKASSVRSVELHSVASRKLLPVFERNARYPVCYTEEGMK